MSLTAHFFAGDTDKLWTTANGGGVGTHTGTPSNGSLVGVWQDEATPATRNITLSRADDGNRPSFATPGAMLLPSLSFNGSSGFLWGSQNNTTPYLYLSNFVGASGKTIIGSFRMTGNATNHATVYENTSIFRDEGAYSGLFLKSSGGVHSIIAYNWDGNADSTTPITISQNTDYVFQMRHDGTNLRLSVLSGAGGATRVDQTVASGATSVTNRQLFVGRTNLATYFTGNIGELYFDNTDLGSTNTPLTDIVGRWLPAAAASSGSMLMLF